jgi:hypothetical protein
MPVGQTGEPSAAIAVSLSERIVGVLFRGETSAVGYYPDTTKMIPVVILDTLRSKRYRNPPLGEVCTL